ncbi:unnamed protein product [Prunus armeniaca]
MQAISYLWKRLCKPISASTRGASSTLVPHTFNQARSEMKCVKYIIKDEIPFRAVEGTRFSTTRKIPYNGDEELRVVKRLFYNTHKCVASFTEVYNVPSISDSVGWAEDTTPASRSTREGIYFKFC